MSDIDLFADLDDAKAPVETVVAETETPVQEEAIQEETVQEEEKTENEENAAIVNDEGKVVFCLI